MKTFTTLRAKMEAVAAQKRDKRWWRHQMKTFPALLAICAGNPLVIGEFPTQRPVTRSFDVFFDLRLNKRLSKKSWGWWFETPSSLLWRHCNATWGLDVWKLLNVFAHRILSLENLIRNGNASIASMQATFTSQIWMSTCCGLILLKKCARH